MLVHAGHAPISHWCQSGSVRKRKRIAVRVLAIAAEQAAPGHDLSELRSVGNQYLPHGSNIMGRDAHLRRTLAHEGAAVKCNDAPVGIEFFQPRSFFRTDSPSTSHENQTIVGILLVKRIVRLIDTLTASNVAASGTP
jgi:hypothetical protein